MGAHTILVHIPDDVIKQMFQFLPTKAAICMRCLSKQWQGVPISDFDEGGEDDDHNFDEHNKFIKMLKFQLELCEKEKQGQTTWDKFRLRMTRYSSKDSTIVYKWLNFSFEKSLKELDLSLGGSRVKNYYYLCRTTFMSAKSLTSLNLEYVRIKNVMKIEDGAEYYYHDPATSKRLLLPCLKTMSLKAVQFDSYALTFLVWECPSIEYLTLTSCCSFECEAILIASKSLKSLELKHSETYQIDLYIDNLESLTIVSSNYLVDNIFLRRSFNLKYMNICDPSLYYLYVQGCHDVKGTIDARNLHTFSFEGYLKSKFSFKAPELRTTSITLLDKWDGKSSTFNNEELKDFLEAFGSCTDMVLDVYDFSDLIFAEDLRKNSKMLPILPNLKDLELIKKNPPTEGRDDQDLMESLYWMAPSLQDITKTLKLS